MIFENVGKLIPSQKQSLGQPRFLPSTEADQVGGTGGGHVPPLYYW